MHKLLFVVMTLLTSTWAASTATASSAGTCIFDAKVTRVGPANVDIVVLKSTKRQKHAHDRKFCRYWKQKKKHSVQLRRAPSDIYPGDVLRLQLRWSKAFHKGRPHSSESWTYTKHLRRSAKRPPKGPQTVKEPAPDASPQRPRLGLFELLVWALFKLL